MTRCITVVEDGVVLYIGQNADEAWKVYEDADGRDVTYVDTTDASRIFCNKKDYLIVKNKSDEILFRNDREAYEYCVRNNLDTEVIRYSFTRDDLCNTAFRCVMEYVKNFRIREDGGCFAVTSASGKCHCDLKNTTTSF